MPRYDYRCSECGAESVVHMSIKDYVEKKYCTFCKSMGIKRIYSVASVQFKGAGWGGNHPQGV